MATALPPEAADVFREIENFPFLETDDEPMDSPWHRDCMVLLISSLLWWWRDRSDFYVGGNMFIYFNRQQAMDRDYRGPDFFVVNGGVTLRPERRFWVVWFENGRYPDVIIELASPSTEHVDRTTKFRIYEQTFRTRNYFIYEPVSGRLDGWELDSSRQYQPLKPNDRGWLWCAELGLWLGAWDGEYHRYETTWLRFYDPQGRVVSTPEEAARQQAEEEKRRADDEKRRADEAEREVARLRARIDQSSGTGA